MKIILTVSHHGEDEDLAHVVSTLPVHIGRGFDNDVILTDPHVEAHHARIEATEEGGWRIVHLGRVNPTVLNGGDVPECAAMSSGDALKLGRTRLHVYAPDHAVPPPVPLKETSSAFFRLLSGYISWPLFLLALVVMIGWSYTAIWSREIGQLLAANGVFAAVAMAVWAGIWAVVGRLSRRRASYTGQIGVISLYAILLCAAWFVGTGLSFLASEALWATIVSEILFAAALAFLLYGCLALATRMPRRKRRQSSLFLACGLTLGMVVVDIVVARQFSPDPNYPWLLRPYLAGMAPAVTPDAFIDDSMTLFDAAARQTP
ncbi:MAG: FHA domain-containing protein [Alphaproteobacteria bacterium]|nr:FHA domain-containing protein [Alphaproteobacteria bacterium]